MPKAFLDLAVDHILATHSNNLSKLLIVLPSRRAGLFLRKKLAAQFSTPTLGPQITVIDSLAEELSGLQKSDALTLQFQLYQSYKEVFGKDSEEFEDFLKWSGRLLQDFNEIDRYTIDAKKLYDNLTEIKKIESWGVDGEMPEVMDTFLTFWKRLHPLYLHFHKELEKGKIGYQGLLYRKAAAELEENSWKPYLESKNADHVLFLGFNALNNAEISIIRSALDNDLADILFDVDDLYLNDEEYEAGMFLRRYKDWPYFSKKPFSFVVDSLKKERRKIELIGVPRTIGMAKATSEKLSEMKAAIPDEDVTEKMALVLAEEGMLLPALNSIPSDFEDINVTMGLPVSKLTLATTVENLFEAQERALRLKSLENRSYQIYHKDIERLLLQSFGQFLLGEDGASKATELSGLIRTYNAPFLSLKKLAEWLPDSLDFLDILTEKSPSEMIQTCSNLLAKYHDAEGTSPEDKEASKMLFRVCNRLLGLYDEFGQEPSMTTTLQLFRQLQKDEKLDFFGEPLKGLQIMGVLETRLLSFERVIITHVNEEVLPAGKSENSFIPYDLKRGFGLPTHREKDAIYAYHFYRLLQGTKHVCLMYDTETKDVGTGEPSRFIEQVRRELSIYENNEIHELIYSTPVEKRQMSTDFELEKGTFLEEAYRRRAKDGVAPSHLQTWVRDPSLFYKRFILRANEADEVEEVMGDRTIGTVAHKVLENFYERFIGKAPRPSDYDEIIKNIGHYLAEAHLQEIKRPIETQGRSGLVVYAISEMLVQFLKEERKRCERYLRDDVDWVIVGTEEKLMHTLEVPGLSYPVMLKGLVDRIDRVDGVYHVIDYKTGSAKLDDLKISSINQLAEKADKSKALQLIMYAWLMSKQHATESAFVAGIFSLRDNRAGLLIAQPMKHQVISASLLEAFEETLISMLQSVFSLEGVISAEQDVDVES